ncbi:hypothetical protein AB4156_43745, partial [Cupriavidus sp. 2MCAB6]|uniref:hypothetical protein n=1 Tax=Cupriavidus sp. 2MCAB6 TaxID=3232981 RepID=UPI003F8FD11F
YGDLDEAAEALEDWLVRKTKRGYRIVSTAMGGNEPELDQGRAFSSEVYTAGEGGYYNPTALVRLTWKRPRRRCVWTRWS